MTTPFHRFAFAALLAFALVAPASAASEEATAYRTNAAHTAQATMPDFQLPVQVRWDVDLGSNVSYPVISNGMAFACTSGNFAVSLYGLDCKNGAIVWGPVTMPLIYMSGIAYDNGQIIVAGEGTSQEARTVVTAVDRDTGRIAWSKQLRGQTDFWGAPTPFLGDLYLQSSGTVSCLRSVDGTLEWQTECETQWGALSVSDSGLFISGGGGNTYRLNAGNGNIEWLFQTASGGGGGHTCATYKGNVFVHDYYEGIFPNEAAAINCVSGKLAKALPTESAEAFDGGFMIAYQEGNLLTGTRLRDFSTVWSVDMSYDHAATAPTIVNGIAYVATVSGFLNGYDGLTGALRAHIALGLTPSPTSESQIDMSAGGGLLIVPCGTHLVAVGTPFSRVKATVSPISRSGKNGWYTGPVSVTLTATAGTVEYTLDGGSVEPYAGPIAVTSEGIHTLKYSAHDLVGNTSGPETLAVRIDSAAPLTTESITGTKLATSAYGGSVSVSLSASDALAGVAGTSYTLDGSGATAYTGPFVVSGAGIHKVVYRSVDNAGNYESAVPLSIELAASRLKTFNSGLQMIGAPFDFSGLSLATIFDEPLMLAVWDPEISNYAVTPNSPADTIRPGAGYWTRVPTSEVDLFDIGKPTDSTSPFGIPLSQGWNIISDPFNIPIALGALSATTPDGRVYPLGALDSIVGTTLYTLNAGASDYTSIKDGALQPFVGYWIYANVSCTLWFPGTIPGPVSPPALIRKQ